MNQLLVNEVSDGQFFSVVINADLWVVCGQPVFPDICVFFVKGHLQGCTVIIGAELEGNLVLGQATEIFLGFT